MTTCIDTIEIYYPLSQGEAGYVACRLDALTHAPSAGPRDQFLSTEQDNADNINVMEYDRFYRLIPGITRIKLLKIKEPWIINRAVYRFKIFIRIKPELLVTGVYSLQLFRCSPANYEALQEAYASAIWRLFPLAFDYSPLDGQLDAYTDSSPPSGAYVNQNLSRLPHLGLCRIERLDVTKDIVVADAARFVTLTKESFQDTRQLHMRTERRGKKRPYLVAESTSKAFKVYDKQQELAEKHTRSPNLPELLQQASNVVRIEYTLKKPDRETINSLFRLNIPKAPDKTSPGFLLCGLIPFLLNDYGDRLFCQVWQTHIGAAPWQSKYHIEKAIENSRVWPDTKELAKDVAYVISQKRSLNAGRAAFTEGVTIHGREILGTEEDFDKGIKTLRKIHVNPLRIPGRWNISRIEADFSLYRSVNVGPEHLPRRPGLPSARAEMYETIKTKLIEIYESYKPP